MLARMRRSGTARDEGFTLTEILVIMLIIGVLAGIAIPVFLVQRKKAQDAAAKSDVTTIGKEVANFFVDNPGSPAVNIVAGRYRLNIVADPGPPAVPASTVDLGRVSPNNALGVQYFVSGTAWCVTVVNPKGDKALVGYKYSAANGLVEGACASANG